VLLEKPLCSLPASATRVSGGDLVRHQWPFFLSLIFSFLPKNYNLIILIIDISTSVSVFFFILAFLYKFYLFSISSLNINLPNITFSNLVIVLWISIFFALTLLQKLHWFLIHHSIRVDSIIFFNLIIVVLNSSFFLDSFVKVIILFNFTL
jgi:hypothetical protein